MNNFEQHAKDLAKAYVSLDKPQLSEEERTELQKIVMRDLIDLVYLHEELQSPHYYISQAHLNDKIPVVQASGYTINYIAKETGDDSIAEPHFTACIEKIK